MSNLGGGFPGVAPTLIGGGAGVNGGSGMIGSNERAMDRFSLVQAWNGAAATGTINGYRRQIGPFRAVNNAGDFCHVLIIHLVVQTRLTMCVVVLPAIKCLVELFKLAPIIPVFHLQHAIPNTFMMDLIIFSLKNYKQ